jgi:hypothetical protein
MKIIIRITSLAAAGLLFISSTQLMAQQASSLGDLLTLVESDRIAESEEYRQRLQQFEQNANQQQEFLDTTDARIVDQEQTQPQLSDTF